LNGGGGCEDCRRRSGLLAELGGVLDLRARDRWKLLELLAREDLELIELIGGRRKQELRDDYGRGALGQGTRGPGLIDARALCLHDPDFPRRLGAPGSPRLLYTDGDETLLRGADDQPCVAVVGTTRPSDYGVEMAHSLAYGLSHSGVVVVTVAADGIAAAARAGSERGGGGSVVLCGDGLGRGRAPRSLPSGRHGRASFCVAGELPPGSSGRRWGRLAAERTVVALSGLVLVVEAEHADEPFAIDLARATEGRLAAVPGRATAPPARGPLELLRAGASLVRSAEDVLELLGLPGATASHTGIESLPGRLSRVLDRVGSGLETPEQLLSSGQRDQTLLALAELELIGHVRRTRDGRYIATAPP
jgi:DNA processing protein